MNKKILNKFLIVFLCILIVTPLYKIYADNITGDIEIKSHYNKDGENLVLSYEEFEVFKIANYIDGQFINDELYKEFDNYHYDMLASDINELALDLNEYTNSNNIKANYIKKGDKEGVTKINNLVPGLYLIRKNENINKEYVLNPFVIAIPFSHNSELFYSLRLDLKYGYGENADKIPFIPNTGLKNKRSDDTNYYRIILIIALSTYLILKITKKESDNKI